MLDFPEFCVRQDMFFDNTLSLFVSQSFSPFLSMDGKNETGRNKIKAHYSESSKFRQSPCLAEQGFPILASFPLRRPPHPRKMGEGAVSGGARHGTLTKKGAGWGLAERIGKPCFPKGRCRQANTVDNKKNTITSFVQRGVNYMRENRVKQVNAIICE